jgi:hypothetical protein
VSAPTCCRECGQPFTAKRAHGENLFCAVDCRKAWNNRRAVRGAQLYDLFMILRYQRGVAKARGVWAIVCRLAQDWREEDHRERAGRQSWREYAVLHDGLLPQRIEKLSGLDYNTHRGAVENGISARSLRSL